MKLLLASCVLLTGCTHSLVLVKAVQVTHGENHFTKCIVEVSDQVSPEIRQRADELCRAVRQQFPPSRPGVVPSPK